MRTLSHDWISITFCSGIVQVIALNCVTEAALTRSTVAPNVQSGKCAERSLPRYYNKIFSYADYSSKRRNHNEMIDEYYLPRRIDDGAFRRYGLRR